MQYQIIGKTVPTVEVTLNKGESMYTQRGGMTWQTQGIQMATNARGGIMKSLGRMFAGESIFMSTYTAEIDQLPPYYIPLLVRSFPYSILSFELIEIPLLKKDNHHK